MPFVPFGRSSRSACVTERSVGAYGAVGATRAGWSRVRYAWDPFPSSRRWFRLPEDRSSRRVCSSSGRPIRLPEDGSVFRKTETQHAQIYQEQSVNMLPGSPQHTGGAKSTKIERHIFRLPEDQPVFQTTRVFRKTGWSSGRWKRIPFICV